MTSEVLKYKPFVALATFPVGTITRIRFLKAEIKKKPYRRTSSEPKFAK